MIESSKVEVMPNLEEHCKRTLKRYGVEGRDIHKWLDKPSRKYTGSHREFRHDSDAIRLVGNLFGEKYGRTLAENIALDHIMLDHEEDIQKRARKKESEKWDLRRLEPRTDVNFEQTEALNMIRILKKRKSKRTLSSLFRKWFPFSEDSGFMDCERCGEKRVKTSVRLGRYTVRVCEECEKELLQWYTVITEWGTGKPSPPVTYHRGFVKCRNCYCELGESTDEWEQALCERCKNKLNTKKDEIVY